jgi:hypothetical protein
MACGVQQEGAAKVVRGVDSCKVVRDGALQVIFEDTKVGRGYQGRSGRLWQQRVKAETVTHVHAEFSPLTLGVMADRKIADEGLGARGIELVTHVHNVDRACVGHEVPEIGESDEQ